MNIVLTCGLSDGKLSSKLKGLIAIPSVENVFLVRRAPISAPKVVNCCPPKWILKSTAIFEVWRLLAVFYFSIKCKAQLVIGIQAQMHGFVAVLVARILRRKSALWLIGSDLFVYSIRGVLAPLVRGAIRNAGTVYVMGDHSKDFVRLLTGRTDRVFVQQVVFSHSGTSSENSSELKLWDMCFVGNLVDVKNPIFLVSILSCIHKVFPGVKLCVVGDGCLRDDMLSRIKHEGLTENVEYVGYVSDPIKYIQKSKILLIPSKSEGLPSVLIEAAQVGVPVVASAVGEIPSVSKGCVGIACVKPEDLDSFVRACLSLLEDYEKFRTASEEIRMFGENYCSHWNVETQCRVWQKALDLCY